VQLFGSFVMAENQINSAEIPAISVILATRGSNIGFLRNCIESLKNQTFRNFEIIVVSKNPKQLQDLFESEHISFIEEKGSTLGAARNLGVKNARGELVSFIDDDAEAPAEWLDKISVTFSRFPSLCCLGGPHFTPQDESERKPMNLVHGLFAEAHLQKTYLDKYAIGKIAGCNVTYKRSVFQEAGYLNENLGTCEDWEFNRRLEEKGYSLRFDPEIWVFHHRQGLKHVFQAFSKSAPFFLSWKTFRLSRTDFFIASVYFANLFCILLLVTLFISPYFSVLLFLSFLVGYVVFTAVRTKTYDRKIFYFPLVILFTAARVLGFYFGLFKYTALKLRTLFVRSESPVEPSSSGRSS
jgi:glycosyltransferase involved in cell wall biosynthesis